MNMKTVLRALFVKSLMLLIFPAGIFAQEIMVDQIVGIVGDNIILQSDIENQYYQMQAQGYTGNARQMKCEIFEDLLVQRLFLNQAMVDSIEVTAAEVENELNRRLQIFINQIGSQERLEEYYNKSLLEIKETFREVIRDQLLTQRMQAELSNDISVVPSEVRDYYKRLPADSIPEIPEQYEIRQIVKNPRISEEAIFEVKERLLELRERIVQGENFSTLAILYSEDPGTAMKGGELGFTSRGSLVKEFADVAFSLKQNQVSQIVETEFGYHIIQLIERRGEQVNVRHILMKPRASEEASQKAIAVLDSLASRIRMDSIPFETAARFLSDDEDTRLSGGIMVNQSTGTTRFTLEEFDRPTRQIIQNLKPGEVSDPFEATDETGRKIYKIIQITRIIPAHRANLDLDYSLIQNMALSEKKSRLLNQWVRDRIAETYIRIDPSFRDCDFTIKGWISESQ